MHQSTSASRDLLADLPLLDDIDAQWPKHVILVALGFPSSVTKALCQYRWDDRETVSLGEIFELLISSDSDPRPGYIVSRLLDCRMVGKKSVVHVIENIAAIDFGRQCNLAWGERYRRYRDSHRMKGSGTHSWSFPITETGRLTARYKTGGLHRPMKETKQMRTRRSC